MYTIVSYIDYKLKGKETTENSISVVTIIAVILLHRHKVWYSLTERFKDKNTHTSTMAYTLSNARFVISLSIVFIVTLQAISMFRITVVIEPDDRWLRPTNPGQPLLNSKSSSFSSDVTSNLKHIPRRKTSIQDLGPMLDILELAGETIDEEMLEKLPTWSKVTSVIGTTKPIIFGLEHCPSIDKDEMILAISGMFNSGTNNLYQLLKMNCNIRSSKYIDIWGKPRLRVRWQTPWGKHEPADRRSSIDDTTTKPNPTYLDDHWSLETILPVLSVRDPYTWMQSMCRKKYRAEWFYTDKHCPNLVPNIIDRQIYRRTKSRTYKINPNRREDKIKVLGGALDDVGFQPNGESVPVKVKYSSVNTTYTSLAHIWGEWYQEYMDADFPFLLVRAEDVIFFPEQVTSQICECAGGTMNENFLLVQEDLKDNDKTGGIKESRDMTSMMARYGSGEKRTNQMTELDLKYAHTHLNTDLMTLFAYEHPMELEPKSSDTQPVHSIALGKTAKKNMIPRLKSESHQPLIDLLYLAGETVDKKTLENLPSWSTVMSVIGSKEPIITGLEQCSSFDQEETILATGGMFNTETNTLFNLLRLNCDIKSKKYTNQFEQSRDRIRFQFPWGRHEPAHMRGNATSRYADTDWELDNILPVITIRDPYTWMQSICKLVTLVHWFCTDHHCPSLVPTVSDGEVFNRMKSRIFVRNPNKRNDEVRVLAGALDDAGFLPDGESVPIKVEYSTFNTTYDSIVNIWNEWYRPYLKADFPKLVVRAEDLLFFPEQVTKQVCECAGGKMRKQFNLINQNQKKSLAAREDGDRFMVDMMVHIGSGARRTQQLTEEDFAFAKRNLDIELMQMYGYQHPEVLDDTIHTGPPEQKVPKRSAPNTKKDSPKLTVSTVGKEPLVALLRDAGERVTDEIVTMLPTWNEVTSLIGDSPIIYGLEHCSSFNQSEAILAVAGMLNTGTNLMYSLLYENCDIFSSIYRHRTGVAQHRVRWQVNWGKHEMPMFREKSDTFPDYNYDMEDILPVLTTRDPYSWMQSMCRKPYVAGWFYTDKHCPNLILTQEDRKLHAKYLKFILQQEKLAASGRKQTRFPYAPGEPRIIGGMNKYGAAIPTGNTVPVTMHYNSENMTFPTIADLWNAYYREYLLDDFPKLQVRAEDLIFFPKEVTKSVCECAGGRIHDMENFNYITKALKDATAKAKYSMVDLLIRYGSGKKRTTQMTKEDLAYANSTLDSDLMQFYGYFHPSRN